MTVADVLIVGGGPAGLAAAIELRRRGVEHVVVLERERDAGGVPRHTHHTGFGWGDMRRLLSGPRYAARHVELARRAGVDLRTETSVTGWAHSAAESDADATSTPRVFDVTSPRGRERLAARAIVLATGCRERPRAARLVPGARPIGVLTTGALQQLVYSERMPVGRRAVIVGAEHVSFSAILSLAHGGARTVAMVTELPRHQSYRALAWLTAGVRRVPILGSTAVTNVLGGRRVEAVDVTDIETGAVRRIACDTVVFTGDWIPDHELARAGALVMDAATRAPRVDGALRTSAPGVFAAGNLVHAAETADVAALSGRHAAASVAAFLTSGEWPRHAPIPLVAMPPIRWISPSAVDPTVDAVPLGRFVARISAFRDGAVIEVRQDGRLLWQDLYRELAPARSIRIDAAWALRVDPLGGPITIAIAE